MAAAASAPVSAALECYNREVSIELVRAIAKTSPKLPISILRALFPLPALLIDQIGKKYPRLSSMYVPSSRVECLECPEAILSINAFAVTLGLKATAEFPSLFVFAATALPTTSLWVDDVLNCSAATTALSNVEAEVESFAAALAILSIVSGPYKEYGVEIVACLANRVFEINTTISENLKDSCEEAATFSTMLQSELRKGLLFDVLMAFPDAFKPCSCWCTEDTKSAASMSPRSLVGIRHNAAKATRKHSHDTSRKIQQCEAAKASASETDLVKLEDEARAMIAKYFGDLFGHACECGVSVLSVSNDQINVIMCILDLLSGAAGGCGCFVAK